MVRFNVEEEPGFLPSLEYTYGDAVADGILAALEAIEQRQLNWQQFTQEYGWLPLVLQGQDTYPGADELHWFGVIVAGIKYQIAAKGPYDALVICSAVQRR